MIANLAGNTKIEAQGECALSIVSGQADGRIINF
jgi:hypothetical protein